MLPFYTEAQAKATTLEYFRGDELAADMVVGKYLLKDREGNFRENSPSDMYKRLAQDFYRIEKGFNTNSAITEDQILNYFENQIILPQGSPSYGIGNPYQLSSLSNCVVVASPVDSISGIIDTGRDLANLFKRRCGVGVDISSLRPQDTQVSNSAGTSTGAWSFADLYSYICRLIGQNGRRGALMISMDVRHPDIEQFIDMKLDKSKVTGANVSVKLTDEFMEAVEQDLPFQQQWPCEGTPTIIRTVQARAIWLKLVTAATTTAEPGLLMWGNSLKYLPAERYAALGFKTIATNPCVTADTWIDTDEGPKQVSELIDTPFTLPDGSLSGDAGFFSTGTKEVIEITTERGFRLKGTADHRLRTTSGWKSLQDLSEIDELVLANPITKWDGPGTEHENGRTRQPYKDRWLDRIITKESIGSQEVYDCTILADHHSYPSNGLISHNCGEVLLSADDSCRLICLNLLKFVRHPFTSRAYFSWSDWQDAVRVAMRLSDNLVELELEKLTEILAKVDTDDERRLWTGLITACRNGRRTGLGTLGLADCLAALQIPYGSETAVEITDAIFDQLKQGAYGESVSLAEERGPFPVYDAALEVDHPFLESLRESTRVRMAKHGRRNISILTNAPTGSKGIEAQTSSGIEPVFRNKYRRRKKINHNSNAIPDFVDAQGDRWQTFDVLHHNVTRYQEITGNQDIPNYFVTSDQLDWNQRLAMQAAVQRHIDHSVSSTINLPRGTTVETVSQIYLEAWKCGLKGVTVYVDGSRDGVLITETPAADKIITSSAPRRPTELPCEIHRADVGNDTWTFLVGLLDGKPYEVFAGKECPAITGSQGRIVKRSFKTVNAKYMLEADGEIYPDLVHLFDNPTEGTLTRTVSMSLRHGVPVQFIVEQLQKDNRESTMFSFSKVLARVLKHHIPDGKIKKLCGECQQPTLTYQEGCVLCTNCGWSKCG